MTRVRLRLAAVRTEQRRLVGFSERMAGAAKALGAAPDTMQALVDEALRQHFAEREALARAGGCGGDDPMDVDEVMGSR